MGWGCCKLLSVFAAVVHFSNYWLLTGSSLGPCTYSMQSFWSAVCDSVSLEPVDLQWLYSNVHYNVNCIQQSLVPHTEQESADSISNRQNDTYISLNKHLLGSFHTQFGVCPVASNGMETQRRWNRNMNMKYESNYITNYKNCVVLWSGWITKGQHFYYYIAIQLINIKLLTRDSWIMVICMLPVDGVM